MISLLITTSLLIGVLSHEQCGFDAALQKELHNDKDGSFHKRIEENERNFQSERHKHIFNKMVRAETNRRGLQDGLFDGKGFSTSEYFKGILEIPVIVHVLYNNDESWISQERIQSQIVGINMDYLAYNDETLPSRWSSLKANYSMAFKLSEVHYIETTKTEFNWDGNEHILGGSPNIEPEHHLNLYTANPPKPTNPTGSTLLGMCTSPTFANNIDGCVISPSVFGLSTFKYIKDEEWKGKLSQTDDLGRTATHELGHWLDLKHTWGEVPVDTFGQDLTDDGVCSNNPDDGVLDTPNQWTSTSGCPSQDSSSYHYSCGNVEPDMDMNFMDYSNDHCLGLFTKGQLEKSLAMLKLSKGEGRKELTDYQQSMKDDRFVNDMYFRALKTDETDESKICGPTDHLISNYGKIYGDYYVYSCASTTNNKYVKVIDAQNVWISTVRYNNCLLIMENDRYLCYNKIPFDQDTVSKMMTVDQLRNKLNAIFADI